MFVLNFVLLFVSLLSLSEAEIFSPFISNGQDAQITEFPYLVSIQEIDVHVCGGTLLNEKWILSAARCFAHRLITNLNIEYGHSEILPGPSGSNKALINSVISHEDYGTSPLVNDIALAESSIPINTGFHQPFVKLIVAGGSKFSSGTPSIHAGWGHIRLGVRTTILQKADADILSHQDCIEATEGTQKPSRNQICSIGKSVLCTSDLGKLLKFFWFAKRNRIFSLKDLHLPSMAFK